MQKGHDCTADEPLMALTVPLVAGVHNLQHPFHSVSHSDHRNSLHYSRSDILPISCGGSQMVVALFPEWWQHW